MIKSFEIGEIVQFNPPACAYHIPVKIVSSGQDPGTWVVEVESDMFPFGYKGFRFQANFETRTITNLTTGRVIQ